MKALTAQMSRLVYIFVVHIHENLGLSRQGPLLNHMVYLKCQHVFFILSNKFQTWGELLASLESNALNYHYLPKMCIEYTVPLLDFEKVMR